MHLSNSGFISQNWLGHFFNLQFRKMPSYAISRILNLCWWHLFVVHLYWRVWISWLFGIKSFRILFIFSFTISLRLVHLFISSLESKSYLRQCTVFCSYFRGVYPRLLRLLSLPSWFNLASVNNNHLFVLLVSLFHLFILF